MGPQGSLLGGIQVTLGLSERHLGWHWLFGVSWDPKSPPFSPPPVLELSLTHRLGPVPLANELLAFVTSKDLDPRLTLDCLAAFEHEVGTPKKPRNHPKKEAEGSHVRPPLFFFPQVLAKRGSRASRRSSSRHGGLRDVHSLQELYRFWGKNGGKKLSLL